MRLIALQEVERTWKDPWVGALILAWLVLLAVRAWAWWYKTALPRWLDVLQVVVAVAGVVLLLVPA